MESKGGPDMENMAGVDPASLPPEADGTSEPRPNSRKAGIITLVIVVVLMLVVLGVALAPKGKPASGVLPADPSGYAAPALSLPRLDGGGTLSLADLAGKPVVVNFWASWCTTCKAEAATLVAAEKKWRDQGVVFLGIDSVDQDAAAKAYEQQYGVGYSSVVDPKGTTASQWYVTAYPESFFISPDGRIISAVRNGVDAKALDQHIEELLK
jgi:cytochrome c biogenesis protein CcmG/thiol:disulfide interchange protein DsbE